MAKESTWETPEEKLSALTEVIRRRMFYIYNGVHFRVKETQRTVDDMKKVLADERDSTPKMLVESLENGIVFLEQVISEYSEVEAELRPFFYDR